MGLKGCSRSMGSVLEVSQQEIIQKHNEVWGQCSAVLKKCALPADLCYLDV